LVVAATEYGAMVFWDSVSAGPSAPAGHISAQGIADVEAPAYTYRPTPNPENALLV